MHMRLSQTLSLVSNQALLRLPETPSPVTLQAMRVAVTPSPVALQVLAIKSRATLILFLDPRLSALGQSLATRKLTQGLRRQNLGAMVHGRSLVSLMNGNSRVDDFGRNGLLVDDGLDVLMDVVVDALAGDNGRFRVGFVSLVVGDRDILELGGIALEEVLLIPLAAVIEGSVFGGEDSLVMLFRPANLVNTRAVKL